MDYRQSFVNTAYNIVVKNEKEISFAALWNAVCEELEVTPEDRVAYVSYFYTQLTLDGRFVTLGENVWDLRIRHTFDKVHIDMNDVYAEEEYDEEAILESLREDEDIKDDLDRLTSEENDDYDEEDDEEEEDL